VHVREKSSRKGDDLALDGSICAALGCSKNGHSRSGSRHPGANRFPIMKTPSENPAAVSAHAREWRSLGEGSRRERNREPRKTGLGCGNRDRN
jgi:hypothetical protein